MGYTVTWEEFYYYLSKHGYSHEHISQHWHYLDKDKNAKITFDEFWRGYKSMAEHTQKQQQVANDDIDEKEQELMMANNHSGKKKLSKVSLL